MVLSNHIEIIIYTSVFILTFITLCIVDNWSQTHKYKEDLEYHILKGGLAAPQEKFPRPTNEEGLGGLFVVALIWPIVLPAVVLYGLIKGILFVFNELRLYPIKKVEKALLLKHKSIALTHPSKCIRDLATEHLKDHT